MADEKLTHPDILEAQRKGELGAEPAVCGRVIFNVVASVRPPGICRDAHYLEYIAREALKAAFVHLDRCGFAIDCEIAETHDIELETEK